MFDHFREMRGEGRSCGPFDPHHRHRRGGFGGGWEEFGRGFGGGGRERLFDNGELRLVILQLIAEKPSYGYEIIKAIEERMGGGYAPSPGVVYPTLTLLEEEGLAEVTRTDGSKKLYAATAEGKEHLKTNKVPLKAILGRMEHAERVFGRGRSPQVMRALMNLKMALKMRMRRGELTTEQVKKIAEIVDGAARAIDEV
ncbi:MAG TPA: PadR family transcriptional regulator [Terracidiphilus sp.]|nr:PadR family transcriptional regulator [Terracidiphilus sp.]